MIVEIFAVLATAGIIVIFAHAVRLWFVSRAAAAPRGATNAADEYLFAFMVPALDEAEVIEHTLDRMLALPIRNCMVVVVDDGSADGTGAIVEARNDPRVQLLRREPPNARKGKGAALNAGLRHLEAKAAGWRPDKVIVTIMDADGRLDPGAPASVAPYFADPDVGGVQIAVRIANRHGSALARMQDMEFVTFTDVFQSARDRWGIAGLGGNGQFVRLTALQTLAPAAWTDGLTEDLEQGLRLICGGWRTRYCRDVAVHQQGLESARALVRQRSRWFQGMLQAWRQIPRILHGAPLRTVPHLLHSLLVPALLLANVVLLAALAAMLGDLAFSPALRSALTRPATLLDWYWLTFALALFLTLTVYARREKALGVRRLIVLGHLFAGYSLMWMAAGYWAVGRMVRRRNGWLKTDRVQDKRHEVADRRPPATAAAGR